MSEEGESRRAVEGPWTEIERDRLQFEKLRKMHDENYRRGTLHGDYNRFLDELAYAENEAEIRAATMRLQPWRKRFRAPDVWTAATNLARHGQFLSSGFANPRVARCLGRLVSRFGKLRVEGILRTEIFPEALVFASQGNDQPRRIRLGRMYLKDAAGRAGAFAPENLPAVAEYYNWLRQEAHRLAEGLVTDRLDESPRRCREMPVGNEVERFLFSSETTPGAREVSRYLAPTGGTKADRALFVFSLRDEGRTSAVIGQALGMTAAAVRQRLSRGDRRSRATR